MEEDVEVDQRGLIDKVSLYHGTYDGYSYGGLTILADTRRSMRTVRFQLKTATDIM